MAIRVTVDALIFRPVKGTLHVLLIERKNPPFQGSWALPGGFVDEGEELEEAARRELEEETGHRPPAGSLRQLGAYGDPERDPRGHAIGIAYFALVEPDEDFAQAGDDAAKARWWPVDQPPPLAFDHSQILEDALRSLRESGRATC